MLSVKGHSDTEAAGKAGIKPGDVFLAASLPSSAPHFRPSQGGRVVKSFRPTRRRVVCVAGPSAVFLGRLQDPSEILIHLKCIPTSKKYTTDTVLWVQTTLHKCSVRYEHEKACLYQYCTMSNAQPVRELFSLPNELNLTERLTA